VINEQQIGIRVCERSPTYVASDDSIVRTQARPVRQRLEESVMFTGLASIVA
jgi:hypothetical protein